MPRGVIGAAYVSVRPDTKGFEASTRAGVVGPLNKIAKVAAGLFVGAKAASFLKDSIGAASDLNEQLSKTKVVFGTGSKAVIAFANTAAESLGQSKTEALANVSTFGNLFRAMEIGRKPATDMSIALDKLGSDLASFNNVPVADALEALRSGIVGEIEPLRRFGVNLSAVAVQAEAVHEGLVKPIRDGPKVVASAERVRIATEKLAIAQKKYGKDSLQARQALSTLHTAQNSYNRVAKGSIPPLTAQQKAIAAYHLILKQTKTAQGDFARTSGGLANQQRILSAEWDNAKAAIGQRLLPVVLQLVRVARDQLPGAIDRATSAVGTMVDVGEQAAPKIQAVASAVQSLISAVGGVGPIAAFVTGIYGAQKAAVAFQTVAKSAFALEVLTNPAGKVAGFRAALAGLTSGFNVAAIAGGALAVIAYKIATGEDAATRATHHLASALGDLHDAQRGAADSADTKRHADQAVADGTIEVTRSTQDVRTAIRARNRDETDLASAITKRNRVQHDGNATDKDQATAQAAVVAAQKKAKGSSDEVVAAYQRHNRATLDLRSAKLHAKEAEDDLRAAQTKSKDANREAAAAITEAGKAAQKTADQYRTGLATAVGGTGVAFSDATVNAAASKRAVDDFVKSMGGVKGAYAPVADALADYAKRVGRIPDKKTLKMIVDAINAGESIDKIRNKIDALDGRVVHVTVATHDAPQTSPTRTRPTGGGGGGSSAPPPTGGGGRRGGSVNPFASAADFVPTARELAATATAAFAALATDPKPKTAAKGAGKSTADEILLAFLNQTRSELPKKWKEALQNSIQTRAEHVRGVQEQVKAAFEAVAEQAFVAFDAVTQKHLDGVTRKFDRMTGQVDASLSGGMTDAIRHAAEVADPHWKNLAAGAQKSIQPQFDKLAKQLGKVWTDLPESVRANLKKGGDALRLSFENDSRAIDDALTGAFDGIQSHLDGVLQGIDDGLNSSLQGISDWADGAKQATDDWLNSALDSIQKWQQELTPTEALLKQQQAAHDAAGAANDLADAQTALADAKAQLNEAQAAGDDAAVLTATKAIADAQRALDEQIFQQQIAQEQTQADAERAQKDAEAAQQEQAARDQAAAELKRIADEQAAREAAVRAAAEQQRVAEQQLADQQRAAAQAQHDAAIAQRTAQFDTDNTALTVAHDRIVAELGRQQGREEVEYQAGRDLLRRHLEARLQVIEAGTVAEKDGWRKHHKEVMALFRSIAGDYDEAGQNLGAAFKRGLLESQKGLSGAAEQLAEAIARYLRLHSPAKLGPLATLDRWWKPFTPTLLRGLDVDGIGSSLPGAPSFGIGRGSGSYGAAGDPAVLRKLDELIRTVREHRDGDLTVLAHGNPGQFLNQVATRVQR